MIKKISYLDIISKNRKTILLTVIAILSAVSILSVGPSYAYLKDEAEPVINSLSADTSVNPTVTGSQINVGATDYSVYVRAAVVINWKNGNTVHSVKPTTADDYTLSVNENWTQKDDGFYLYGVAVPSGTPISVPVTVTAKPGSVPPEEGYTLSVDFLVQTIQSAGTTDGTDSGVKAINDAWGYDI